MDYSISRPMGENPILTITMKGSTINYQLRKIASINIDKTPDDTDYHRVSVRCDGSVDAFRIEGKYLKKMEEIVQCWIDNLK